MSTNFYLLGNGEVEDIHLGKRFGAGNGEVGFLWALHAEDAARLIEEWQWIVDESGAYWAPAQFEEMVRSCRVHDTSAIGKVFI